MKRGRSVSASTVTLLNFFARAPKQCSTEPAQPTARAPKQCSPEPAQPTSKTSLPALVEASAPCASVELPTLPFSDPSASEPASNSRAKREAANATASPSSQDLHAGDIGLEEALEMVIEAHSPKAQLMTTRQDQQAYVDIVAEGGSPLSEDVNASPLPEQRSSVVLRTPVRRRNPGETMDASCIFSSPPKSPSTGSFGGLSSRVLTLIWSYAGARRCCVIRQASCSVAKICPMNRSALKRDLEMWALTIVDASAMQPAAAWVAKAASGNDTPMGAGARLGRWGDFTVLTDGAGRHLVRGPSLLRCTQRWRLRARAARLSSLPPPWGDVEADMPLREALRRSRESEVAADGEGAKIELSVHSTASIWDAPSSRPSKRARKGNDVLPKGANDGSPTASSGAVLDGTPQTSADACGLFSMKRWDALMDPRVPWRLRSAALVYHHHCVRGCSHAGSRDTAAAYIRTHTRHDERLRASLLDQGGV